MKRRLKMENVTQSQRWEHLDRRNVFLEVEKQGNAKQDPLMKQKIVLEKRCSFALLDDSSFLKQHPFEQHLW